MDDLEPDSLIFDHCLTHAEKSSQTFRYCLPRFFDRYDPTMNRFCTRTLVAELEQAAEI